MKYALKLLPIVYKDLQKAKKWYTTINADLGEDFRNKINQEFEYINQYPKHYQKNIWTLDKDLFPDFHIPFTT